MIQSSKQFPKRKSNRLDSYDYSQTGSYFITICAYKRKNIFCKILQHTVYPTIIGKIIDECWEEIPQHFTNVATEEYVLMPNHVHGIISIHNEKYSSDQNIYLTIDDMTNSLGVIVRSFKSAVTRRVRIRLCDQNLRVWQRNYYEHVIRNEIDFDEIKQYIINNPIKWELDSLYCKDM